ncbi:MAG TPA: hypothetical protein VGC29_06000, partial [Flavisolibacter sp.]
MKHLTLIILSSIIITSCETKKKGQIGDEYPQMVLVTNKSENIYLTQTLNGFSNVSDVAKVYVEKLLELETKATELKTLLEKQQVIPKKYQENFINTFSKSLDYINVSDSTDLELLKIISITSSEDIDQLLLFMKRSYVKNLSSNNKYLFNMVGTSAEVENSNIKNGEPFSANMNITAANINKPADWFILKDG